MNSWLDALLGGRRTRLHEQRRAAWKRFPSALPRILGHRGARHAEPDNTLRAFDRALAEGADGIELDVRMTRDGQLVVYHDPRLPGPTDAARLDSAAPSPAEPLEPTGPWLSTLTAEELSRLRPQGEPIPTLEEILSWQRLTGAWLNVELKGDLPARSRLVQSASELVRAHGGDRILISSFYPHMLVECALRLPDVPTAWLVHSEQRLLKTAPGWRWTGADGVHPELKELAPARLTALLERGAIVNVWTVDEPEAALELSDLGVDGLITDHPARILHALEAAARQSSLSEAQSEQVD